ncbi:hypothetical protein PVK06_049123 [Gossypium arboreum]|uniref:Secreted protein n=1 Tax=Gossypium arboreum TaxID=29729 RepID=A0ABR0MHV0_GOSAR|nr:hypothetical protein PVK06_049123 [Gossypium arboreum]
MPVWAHTLVWTTRLGWPYPYGSHGLAQKPTRFLPVWPTHSVRFNPCGPHGHTVATTRLCVVHDHVFVDHTVVLSYTAYHMGDHTPVWRRQWVFFAFIESHFSAFRTNRRRKENIGTIQTVRVALLHYRLLLHKIDRSQSITTHDAVKQDIPKP